MENVNQTLNKNIHQNLIQKLKLISLESQGLLKESYFGNEKNAVLKVLEHLGYIQIDTLSIIKRAHHHSLWTRISDYKPEYLDELVKEKKVFEYWFHAASYLPMKDFRFCLPQMLDVKRNKFHYYKADPKIMKYIMDTIRSEGAKKVKDFESQKNRSGTWWNWKPTKIALERLFMQGDLMISGRDGMLKTYDLTENILPSEVDTRIPTPYEYAEYLVNTNLRAYGFTYLKQITHLRNSDLLKKNVIEVLESLIREKKIQRINLENLQTIFIKSDLLEKKISTPKSNLRILSPFDNSIIHRDRIKDFFDFDFRLECYIPKEKRVFGYFCLPILFGDSFIGRVDCKAHRKEGVFELIYLHIENQNIKIESYLEAFKKSIKNFAEFNHCKTVKLTNVNPNKLIKLLRNSLK